MYRLINVCIVFGIISLTHSNTISDKGIFKENDILRDEYQINDDVVIVNNNVSNIDGDETDDSSDEDGDDTSKIVKSMDGSDIVEHLSLEDQVRLLSKQMSALMTRRREDYKMLENSLKKSVRKNAKLFADSDIRSEFEQLR